MEEEGAASIMLEKNWFLVDWVILFAVRLADAKKKWKVKPPEVVFFAFVYGSHESVFYDRVICHSLVKWKCSVKETPSVDMIFVALSIFVKNPRRFLTFMEFLFDTRVNGFFYKRIVRMYNLHVIQEWKEFQDRSMESYL